MEFVRPGRGRFVVSSLGFGVSLQRIAMTGSSGLLCRVRASNVRCGVCFSELADWRSRGWGVGLRREAVSLNSDRVLVDSGYESVSLLCFLFIPYCD